MREVDTTLEGMLRLLTAKRGIEKITLAVYEHLGDSDYLMTESKLTPIRLPLESVSQPKFNLRDLSRRMITSPYYALGMTSKVWTRHGVKHIFMIDFDISSSPRDSKKSIELIEECLKHLRQPNGVLVKTDESFHFYGSGSLLGIKEWVHSMRKAMKFEIIGRTYPACQIKQGFCNLRISDCAGYLKNRPRVIGIIGKVEHINQLPLF